MRKLSLILAVLVLTAPAWARVDITCEQTDYNEVTVSYTVTGEPNKVRAFALDITLDNDVNITDVNTSANLEYTIFPGSVSISGGEVTDEGEAVADPCDYPPDTQPGLGSSGVTIEMGALWSPPNDGADDAPPDSNVLLKFYVEAWSAVTSCTVTITENEARGGVVLTNPDEDPDVNAPDFTVREPNCLVGGNAGPAEYSDWVSWNYPDCWCYKYQCRGDADGKQEYSTYWVLMVDLDALAVAIGKTDAQLALIPNGICTDFDHRNEYSTYRVLMNDLAILAEYIGGTSIPDCDQADPSNPIYPDVVYTGPYNFWTTP